MKLLRDLIKVKKVTEYTTPSGIILFVSEKDTNRGEVIEIGMGVKQIKVGDIVIIGKAGFNHEEFRILREADVLAKVI